MRRILALALLAVALLGTSAWHQVAEAQTPAPNIERFPVRWVETPDPLGLDDFKEPAEPFAEERARALQGPPFEIGPPAWGLYVIDAAKDGDPRSVLETKRQLHGLKWDGSNLKTSFETRFSGYSSVLQRPRTFSWQGTYDVDVAKGRATATFDLAPQTDYGLRFEDPLCTVNRTLCFEVTAVPETKLLLTTASRGASMQHTPYLVDANRRARVLDGFPSAPHLTPSPDNGLIYSYTGTGDLTLVPTSDGDAVIVHGVTNYAIGQPLFPSGRLFFAVARAGSPCCFDDFYTYDMTTGALEHIGAAEFDRQPTELFWDTPDSVKNHTQRLNLSTGAVTLLEDEPRPKEDERRLGPTPPVKGPQSTLFGRYELSTVDVPLPAAPQGDCRLLPRKIMMTDTTTGTETTLFECPTGGPAIAQWLDGETILISATTSTCCHGSGYRYLLYKYITGAMFELNQTINRDHQSYVSPDGTRILIKAEHLIVYNLNAEVVRNYGAAPDGWQFYEAAWSPDSASIAFILEPKNWPHGL